MPDAQARRILALALRPSARGFGYAVFDGRQELVDWGHKYVRGGSKNPESLAKARHLMDWFHPEALVLPAVSAHGERRSKRIRELVRRIGRVATKRGIPIHSFERADVLAVFAPLGAHTKHAIATAITAQLPDLELWLPPPRRIWMNEDPRMGIFDAAALAFAYFRQVEHPATEIE